MKRKTILVTGANKGIGFAAAGQFADLGYTVYLGARDTALGTAAAQTLSGRGDVRFLQLNVTSDDSVRQAASRLAEEVECLDALVNNAAIFPRFPPVPPSEASVELLRAAYETNVFGVVAVTLAMLPLLRKAAQPRVVNLSSRLGSIALVEPAGVRRNPPSLEYHTSKTALNAVTAHFAAEFLGTPFKFNAASPGRVRTQMIQETEGRPPDEGARIVVHLATLPPDGPTGGFFSDEGPVPW